jgi:hypothetical protein
LDDIIYVQVCQELPTPAMPSAVLSLTAFLFSLFSWRKQIETAYLFGKI